MMKITIKKGIVHYRSHLQINSPYQNLLCSDEELYKLRRNVICCIPFRKAIPSGKKSTFYFYKKKEFVIMITNEDLNPDEKMNNIINI